MIKRMVPLILMFAGLPRLVAACSVCYGDPDHPMSKGLDAGVFILLLVTVLVLSWFGALIWYFKKRIAKHKND